MQLPWQCHPPSLADRMESFWSLWLEDQDFRFPEVRRRLGVDLRLRLQALVIGESQSTLRQLIETVITEFEQDPEQISSVEFFALLEWSERYLQALTGLQILEALKGPQTTELDRAVEHRLKVIESEIVALPLTMQSSWWDLLAFRWRFASLRAEVQYLLELQKSAR